jgi:type VI secretion system protein ImpE
MRATAAGARALFDGGRLDEAVAALGAELRADPGNARARVFLFELLSFAGDYARAERQLAAVAHESREAEQGAWLYRSALHAERIRQDRFARGEVPRGPARPVAGRLNGVEFASLTDADPRVGARLEVFAAGQYTTIPLEQLAAVDLAPPARLRDLLWAPARLQAAPAFEQAGPGELLLPVLTPLTWRHVGGAVRLGRMTAWERGPDGTDVPVGQKLLRVDGELVPFLEVRELRIFAPAS